MLRTIPAVLAALLLGAHFLRAQNLPLLIASLALAAILLVPRRTVRLLCRICLAAGAAEWGLTAWRIAQARMAHGEPYVRMLVILGGVAAFTTAAAWLLPAAARDERPACAGRPGHAGGGACRPKSTDHEGPPADGAGTSSCLSGARIRTPKPEWS